MNGHIVTPFRRWPELFPLTSANHWHASSGWGEAPLEHGQPGPWPSVQWSFVLDVIKFSEPFNAATARPEPELVTAEWDDDAFREAAAEMALSHEGDEDDDSGL
jgi:hypothetical protein